MKFERDNIRFTWRISIYYWEIAVIVAVFTFITVIVL